MSRRATSIGSDSMVRTERFLRDAGPVSWNRHELRGAALDPVSCRMPDAAAGIEPDTGITRDQAAALGIDRAPDLAAFLPVWAAEEAEHADALRALVAGRGYPAVP